MNVRAAMRQDELTTFAALYAITKDMLDYLEMNKTLRTQDDIQHAVSTLIQEFPAYKLEEWRIIMDRFKAGHFGNLYERLKLPELREAFLKFSEERSVLMEREYTTQKQEYETKPAELSEEQRSILKKIIVDLKLTDSDTDDKGRWKHIPYPNSSDAESENQKPTKENPR